MRELDIDSYMGRTFHIRDYNCWHLLQDAWRDLTGRDLGDRTPIRVTFAALIGRFDTDVPEFTELPGPKDPSLVLMRRSGTVPHCGVYVRGRVLQMTPTGVSYLPVEVATAGFAQVGFYE